MSRVGWAATRRAKNGVPSTPYQAETGNNRVQNFKVDLAMDTSPAIQAQRRLGASYPLHRNDLRTARLKYVPLYC